MSDDPEDAATRETYPAGAGEGMPEAERCELCGGPVLHRHCKLLCTRCGFVRDCSDP